MADTSKVSPLKLSMNYTSTFNTLKLNTSLHTFGCRPTMKYVYVYIISFMFARKSGDFSGHFCCSSLVHFEVQNWRTGITLGLLAQLPWILFPCKINVGSCICIIIPLLWLSTKYGALTQNKGGGEKGLMRSLRSSHRTTTSSTAPPQLTTRNKWKWQVKSTRIKTPVRFKSKNSDSIVNEYASSSLLTTVCSNYTIAAISNPQSIVPTVNYKTTKTMSINLNEC